MTLHKEVLGHLKTLNRSSSQPFILPELTRYGFSLNLFIKIAEIGFISVQSLV